MAVMLCDKEGNRRSGIALVMRYHLWRLCALPVTLLTQFGIFIPLRITYRYTKPSKFTQMDSFWPKSFTTGGCEIC